MVYREQLLKRSLARPTLMSITACPSQSNNPKRRPAGKVKDENRRQTLRGRARSISIASILRRLPSVSRAGVDAMLPMTNGLVGCSAEKTARLSSVSRSYFCSIGSSGQLPGMGREWMESARYALLSSSGACFAAMVFLREAPWFFSCLAWSTAWRCVMESSWLFH